ncbi:MAG: hypothetical protein V4598_18140 [Bdellovibrionota bacterium]
MMFLPILFIAFAFAQEELQIETYCFSSVPARARTEKKLASILVPSDKIEAEKSCFTLQMRPHRRELLQNYIRNLDSDVNITYSSAEIKREPCQLQVEKIRLRKNSNTSVQVSETPDASAGQQNETARDVMQIQTLNKFSFVVSQDAIEGECRYINKDLYEITINARRDPKPILPANLPPGTVVVIPTPPAAEKTLNVTTTLQLNRGDKKEIGSIVKDLRKNDQKVDVKPEAQIENADQMEEEKVFLSFQ